MAHKIEIEIDDVHWEALCRVSSMTQFRISDFTKETLTPLLHHDIKLVIEASINSLDPKLAEFPEIKALLG